MKTCLRNICLITSFLLLFACSREAKVIPRGKMAQIYAEMLVTDQWINSTPSVKRMADTSLVYEPILEKYGYSSADYRKSVETYMDDPERYSRILRTSAEILDKRGAQGGMCGMDPTFVKKVYEAIHEESVRQQMEIINQ